MMEIALFTATLMLAAIWSLICRIRQMQPGRTRVVVFIQHAGLALALFAALLLPPEWGKAVLAGGVLLFLTIGSMTHWRRKAPQWSEHSDTDPDAVLDWARVWEPLDKA